jgi:outer membrane protein TolC
VPTVPAVLPGELLQRRPDVASAERKVAAANANIGVKKAAFFPDIGLSGSLGSSSGALGDLFSASASLWSLGAQASETLIDFGARKAQVKEARAAYDQAVAQYRQTALTAFQQTEDGLAAMRVLGQVAAERTGGAASSGKPPGPPSISILRARSTTPGR